MSVETLKSQSQRSKLTKSESRLATSDRLYQVVIRKTQPGKNPAGKGKSQLLFLAKTIRLTFKNTENRSTDGESLPRSAEGHSSHDSSP